MREHREKVTIPKREYYMSFVYNNKSNEQEKQLFKSISDENEHVYRVYGRK
jgi:hypothetical protein